MYSTFFIYPTHFFIVYHFIFKTPGIALCMKCCTEINSLEHSITVWVNTHGNKMENNNLKCTTDNPNCLEQNMFKRKKLKLNYNSHFIWIKTTAVILCNTTFVKIHIRDSLCTCEVLGLDSGLVFNVAPFSPGSCEDAELDEVSKR